MKQNEPIPGTSPEEIKAFQAGETAFRDGLKTEDNPYATGTKTNLEWLSGFLFAQDYAWRLE